MPTLTLYLVLSVVTSHSVNQKTVLTFHSIKRIEAMRAQWVVRLINTPSLAIADRLRAVLGRTNVRGVINALLQTQSRRLR